MGVAYRAEDVNHGRQVVLKVLPPEAAADSVRLARFRREARACSLLDHPGITAIYEASESDGIYYICMEYVEGRTLRRVLTDGEVPLPRALGLILKVCEAVGAAHARGIVHRDLKPENIMVTPRGEAKVLDFGLAAFDAAPPDADVGDLPTEVERLTSAGTRMGTPAYMSPEQARARPAGPASDVFSLGTILYELVAGAPPFRGDSDLAILHGIVYDQPPPLRVRRPGIPAALESLVRRALKKDPGERHPDAGALALDLGHCAAAMPDSMRARGEDTEDAISAPSAPRTATPLPRLIVRRPGEAPLVGRSSDLKSLKQAVEAALDGTGQVILVSGEAGIGKSRLVAECGSIVEALGGSYVTGRCLFREGGLPYQPLVEAAERLVALLGIESAQELESYLAQRMPALSGRHQILLSFLHLPGSLPEESGQAVNREHLLDAIAAFFVLAARDRPLLLHVDDLHWADDGTLDLFGYLARGFRRSRGLLVGTWRPEDAPTLVTRLAPADPFTHIPLARLTAAETSEMIRAALPGAEPVAEFVERLQEDTAGNPLFVLEAIRLLRADGLVRQEAEGWVIDPGAVRAAIPGKVRDVIARRLSRLGADARQLMEAGACDGMTFRSSTLAACLGKERLEILSTLQALERDHRLVHVERDAYTFDHPMIRETLYEETLPELRREYHSRIAKHLISRSGGDLLSGLTRGATGSSPHRSVSSVGVARQRTEAAAIAHQLLQAGEETGAVPYLLVSAAHARTLFANRDAEATLAKALGILEQPGAAIPEAGEPALRWRIKAHKDRGKIRVRLGAFEAAREDFAAMREDARSGGLLDKEAHAENLLADLSVRSGDYAAGLLHARRAYELAQESGDRHSLARSLAVLGAVHFHHGEFEEALAAHSRAITLQQAIGDQSGYADSLNKIGNIHLRQARTEEALTAYTSALAAAQAIEHRLNEAEALNNNAAVHHERGDLDEALRHYRASLELKREIGDRRSIARSLNNLGLLHEIRGEFGLALGAHEESLALKRELGDQSGLSSTQSNLGSLFERMGDYGRALQCCEESLALKEVLGETWSIPSCKNALGRVGLALNAVEEAERLFSDALALTREQGDRSEEARSLANMGEASLVAGRPGEAQRLLEEAEATSRILGLGETRVLSLYLLGLAALARGEAGAAAERLRELEGARAALASTQERLFELHLGGLVRKAAGEPEAARALLREAISLAEEIGLRGLEWRILQDAGLKREAREALLTLAEGIPSQEMRERFLSSPRAAQALGDDAPG